MRAERPCTVVRRHERERAMARRKLTVDRYAEIKRRLAEGRGVREISRALGCSRRLVREIRAGLKDSPVVPKALSDPLWMAQLDWLTIIHDLGLGHPLKFLWEERAQHLTTYSNFWKQFLPQVSAVPRSLRHGARVRAGRTRGGRLRRGADRVDRAQDR
jgi:hypothetical protein